MTASLAGKRILIVEDEYFIASDLKRALEGEAAIVLGPVGELAKGLDMLHAATPDAAILDVNLQGEDSYAIADSLASRAIPYMFLTGYDAWALRGEYRAIPRLSKPFETQAVLDCVETLLAMEAST